MRLVIFGSVCTSTHVGGVAALRRCGVAALRPFFSQSFPDSRADNLRSRGLFCFPAGAFCGSGTVFRQPDGVFPHTNGGVSGTNVELDFNLDEHTGLWIESQRQGEPAFTALATDAASPYRNNRPLKTPGQPEWRDYRACWWDNDTATMAFGPVQRVLVTG